MKNFPLLAELYATDQEIINIEDYRLRNAVRGVIVDEKNHLGLFYRWNHDAYTFPGGGAEEGETLEQALRREMREEAGVDICDIVPLGMTLEYFQEYQSKNYSYGFFAKVSGEKKELQLEEYEIEAGAKVNWFSFDEAQKIIQEQVPPDKSSALIQKRDLLLLEAAENLVGTHQ